MSGFSQRYKDKVETRSRGAGSHASTFRNFTITKGAGANLPLPPESPAADYQDLEDQENETIRVNSSSHGKKHTPRRRTPSPQFPIIREEHLPEKYQERINERSRGAGTHKPTFRNFVINAAPPLPLPPPKVGAREQRRGAERKEESRASGAIRKAITPRDSLPPLPPQSASSTTSRTTAARSETSKSQRLLPVTETPLPPRIPAMLSTDRVARGDSRLSGTVIDHKTSWGVNATKITNDVRLDYSSSASSTPSMGSGRKRNVRGMDQDFPFSGSSDALTVSRKTSSRRDQRLSEGDEAFDRSDYVLHGTSVGQRQSPISTSDGHPTKKRKVVELETPTTVVARATNEASVSDDYILQPLEDDYGGNDYDNYDEEEQHYVNVPSSPPRTTMERTDNRYQLTTPRLATSLQRSKSPASTAILATKKAVLATPSNSTITVPRMAARSDTADVLRSSQQGSLSKIALKSKPLMQSALSKPWPSGKSAQARRTYGSVEEDDEDEDKLARRRNTGKGKKKASFISASVSSASQPKSSSNSTRTSTNPVKVYKQLQIQCLKFFGSAVPLSRPAAMSDKAKNRTQNNNDDELEGQTGAKISKTLQGLLTVDNSAPVSEMDVISEAIRGVISEFLDTVEDPAALRVLNLMRSELDVQLIEQVDLLDDHSLLRSSLKKATGLKKELRVRLLGAQRRRHRAQETLAQARKAFEIEQKQRQQLEETHLFLTDLENLRDDVENGAIPSESSITRGPPPLTDMAGLHSLMALVSSRSCEQAAVSENSGSKSAVGGSLVANTATGMLASLREFNQMLEDTTDALEVL